MVENHGSLRKSIFTKPEGSQSGGVKIYIFSNLEGSQSGGVLFSQNRRVSIRRGLTFANPEGSQTGSQFCRSGGVLFSPIRRSTVFVNPEGHYFIKRLRQIEEKIIMRSVKLLRNRLGTSDCTGNLPLKKKTRPKQNRSKLGYSRH